MRHKFIFFKNILTTWASALFFVFFFLFFFFDKKFFRRGPHPALKSRRANFSSPGPAPPAGLPPARSLALLGQCFVFPDVFHSKETLGVNGGLRWDKKSEEPYQRIQVFLKKLISYILQLLDIAKDRGTEKEISTIHLALSSLFIL